MFLRCGEFETGSQSSSFGSHTVVHRRQRDSVGRLHSTRNPPASLGQFFIKTELVADQNRSGMKHRAEVDYARSRNSFSFIGIDSHCRFFLIDSFHRFARFNRCLRASVQAVPNVRSKNS